ncbi:leucine-rich repeat protein soc-2 homolog [Ylistrum balloti]|uniref:leucine-rich repeat protein soc-2 homolog n=1 Tax=Ylistrum balloti TaxID=509963 RepID=UPI002905D306|nr:leucine-rich repeat protein soc-2 homolog [Ylistrum balloti]
MAIHETYVIFTLLLIFVIKCSSELVDPRPCPAKPPCSCDFNTVECHNLTQTEFPTFTRVNSTWHCWRLHLNYNYNIKSIPAGAFSNLPICSLQIGHNALEVIEDWALNGSEPYLDFVFMQFNNFTELPSEIARMPNITMLSIHDNPIKDLPQKMAFASKLQFLDIGSPEMTTWPSSIRTLKSVWSLTLYKLPMTDLPFDAFEGLEDSKISVTCYTAKFKGIPKAMRRLQKMTGLLIADDVELSSAGIPEDAFNGIESLTEITISNSSITTVFNMSAIPTLTQLSISNSPLSTWDVSTLPEQPLLQSVGFSNTNIDRIPAAVRRINRLYTLALDNTKISSIGPGDLAGLQKLQELNFRQTPLTNISMDAFNDMYSLMSLNLDFTNLSGFPRAIERLPALRFLSLQNITIDCSCAELGWMKKWIGYKQLRASDGECHNIRMDLFEYIRNEVPKCP